MSSCSKEICSPQWETRWKSQVSGSWKVLRAQGRAQIGMFLSAPVSCCLFGWGVVTASWGDFLPAIHFFLKEWNVFYFLEEWQEPNKQNSSCSLPGRTQGCAAVGVQSCPSSLGCCCLSLHLWNVAGIALVSSRLLPGCFPSDTLFCGLLYRAVSVNIFACNSHQGGLSTSHSWQ